MSRVVGRRLLEAFFSILLFSVLVFGATHVIGDPVATMLGADASQEQRASLRAELGLDQPLVEQYFSFITAAVQGDLGRSYHTQAPVWDSIQDRAPSSLVLAALAMLTAIIIAVPLGVIAATRKGGAPDFFARTIALVGQGTPSFLLAMIAVWVFALELEWLPAGGKSGPTSYVLPVLTLALFIGAGIIRLLRSSLIEVLQSDYVLYARSLGLPNWRIVWLWALPNAAVSVIAFIGFMFGVIIAGAIVIEAVFVWPGLGTLAYQAVLTRDLLLIQGTVLVIALFMITANLLADLSQMAIDPRVRSPRKVK